MASTLVVSALALVLVIAVLPAPAQEPTITRQSEVTLVGCVERELDYRAKGGGETSTVVTDEDMVLVRATAPGVARADAAALAGDYGLTGTLEAQLRNDVGRRVEIAGFIEDMATHVTPRKTRTLRRLFIKAWKAAGAC